MTFHCHVSVHRHIGEHGAHRLQSQARQHFYNIGREASPAIDLQTVVKAVQGQEVAALCVLSGMQCVNTPQDVLTYHSDLHSSKCNVIPVTRGMPLTGQALNRGTKRCSRYARAIMDPLSCQMVAV